MCSHSPTTMRPMSATERTVMTIAPGRKSRIAPFITVRANMNVKTLSTPPVSVTSTSDVRRSPMSWKYAKAAWFLRRGRRTA